MSNSDCTRTCSACKVELPISEFYEHKRPKLHNGPYYYPQCKSCWNEYQRKRNSNREWSNQVRQRWKSKNREVWSRVESRYRNKNKDKLNLRQRIRDAKIRGSGGKPTVGDVEFLRNIQSGLCVYCSADLMLGFHIDHIIPVSLGGSSYIDNLQLLCPSCNFKKSNIHPVEYEKSIGFNRGKMTNQCKEIMPDGAQCKAYEAKGSGYCAGHARKRGLLTFEKKVSTKSVEVGEPGPLAALRSITIAMERGEGVDPVAATQLANLLRPYLGIAPLDSVQLVGQIDTRRAADEQVAERERAERILLERSLSLVQDDPDPREKERILAKAARDLEMASANFRTRMQMTTLSLKNEPQDQVYGSGEDELYSVNGVRIVVPAEGQYRVPASIASMHRERIKGKREMLARSRLMQTTPEYTEVQRGMASIDSTYGTKSQLGGGAQQEVSDYLVAEEIK